MSRARPRIAVIDYGAGNLVSIDQAFTSVGADVTLVHDGEAMRDVHADAVVVPGVGAAAPAMARLARHGLTVPIRSWIADDRPFLGICLGLQLLFEGSDEDGATTLGVLRGRTVRLEDAPTLPHIGWNQVDPVRRHPLFDGIAPGADFYFVHSYVGAPATTEGAPEPADADPSRDTATSHYDVATIVGSEGIALATTEHGRPFVSAVARGSLAGVQFHPERSGADGLRLLANFVDLVRMAA